MPTIKELKNQLSQINSIKLVAQALGEIATIKLKNTRQSVLHNSLYFKEVSNVYHALKILLAKRSRTTPNTTYVKNGQSISVVHTSNEHFYGGIDSRLTEFFITHTRKYPTNLLIIGRSGIEYLKKISFNQPYDAVILKKDLPNSEELKKLVAKTINYSKIYVYHSKFVSILKQSEEISDISESNAEKEALGLNIDYILEPELDKMLLFFETQIFISLFQSIFLEAELAKTAARMNAMYAAENNATTEAKKTKQIINKLKSNIQNIRILETYSQTSLLLKEEASRMT